MTAHLAPEMAASHRRVGRDLFPGGRVVRLLAGLLFLASVADSLLTAAAGPLSWRLLGLLAMVFTLGAAGYTALVAVLGGRVLTRVDPWLGAAILYAPLAVILTLPFVPAWAAVGASLFIGASLVVEAVIGYGGCEIAGIPTLLLRRRYTIYCLFNSADLAERALRDRSRWAAGVVAVVAFVAVTAVYEWVTLTIIHRAAALTSWLIYLVFLLAGFAANRALRARSTQGVAQRS